MNRHTPVLLSEVVEVLQPTLGSEFVDLTAGYGGHSAALIESIGDSGFGYLFDKDQQAVEYLKNKFKNNNHIRVNHADFGALDWENDIPMVDIILADIGVSSPQIDNPKRGFSFQSDAKLDMRMDQSQQLSAYEVVNTYPEKQLADILYENAEERQSRKLANAIVKARSLSPITSTKQLADIITDTIPKTGKIHPATKCFQAIRIEVNNELESLRTLLENAPQRLNIGGRLAIISFHSLEDRMVKQAFTNLSKPQKDEFGQNVSEPSFKRVTKKPIMGSKYDKSNPRSRSAKLRVVEKIK